MGGHSQEGNAAKENARTGSDTAEETRKQRQGPTEEREDTGDTRVRSCDCISEEICRSAEPYLDNAFLMMHRIHGRLAGIRMTLALASTRARFGRNGWGPRGGGCLTTDDSAVSCKIKGILCGENSNANHQMVPV